MPDDLALVEHASQHTLAATCPHLAGFDPAMADPFELLAGVRAEAPVFYIPELGYWCVTRYEDVAQIYRDPHTFSSEGMHDMRVKMPPAVVEEVGADYVFPFKGQLNTTDPPQHTRIRKLMQKAFTPRQVGGRADEIRALAHALIDAMPKQGRVELVSAYTSPVPTGVIAFVLGMPAELAPKFTTWVNAFFTLSASATLPEEEATRHWRALIEFERITRAFVEERRANPTDDLTSSMILATSDDGSPSLTDDELLANILGLIAAASDTTSILIANTIYQMLKNRERWEEVQADRSLVAGAVEEALRLNSPVRGNRRIVMEDVELGGVTIPKGSEVYFMIASANRDESLFEHPNDFDVHRRNATEHLGLGKWTHFCLGAALARLEVQIAVDVLLDRLPDLELSSGQEKELDYSYNIVVPILNALYVEVS